MSPPANEHEAARLSALRECEIMDTGSEPAFDELTRLAATICQAPIATVCLVDDHRQWNKSMVGTTSRESGRDECFCGYAINNLGPLIVPDATKDPRFKDIPEVVGKPFFRAYAGIPLILQGGHAVGLLCVVDKKPRPFTVEQVDALHVLARHTAALLELRRRTMLHAKLEAELRASEQRYRGVIESQAEMITRFLGDGTLTFVNEAYCRYFGLPRDRLVGRCLFDLLPASSRQTVRDLIASLPSSGEPVHIENEVRHPDGRIAWTHWTNRAITGIGGHIIEYQSFGWDITARKAAEEALRASEQRFREVVESQTEMIKRFLGDGTITFANEAYCRFLGIPRDKLIGSSLFDLHPANAHPWVRNLIASLPASGEPVHVETELWRADGSRRWTRWANRAIADGQGRIVEYQSFGWDVSDRKNAEIALAASEKKFREIVENLSEMVCRYLPDTTLTFVNKAYCARMGASAEELIGRKFLDYLPASEHERLLQHIAQLPRTGEPVQYEHMGPMPGGKIGWQRWTDRAILDEAGNVVEFQGFGWDVTDRKLAEIAMRESASKFRTVAEHSPFGLFITDSAGGCLYTNPAYERISGQKTAESLGAGWGNAVHPEDLERIRSGWEQAVRERREFSGDKRYLHPDGKVVYGVVRAAPFFKEGEIEGYVGTVKDCSDFYLARASLESANAELSRTNRKLEERHRELIQLAYAMTHDLQTPVATIGAAVASLENALGENVTPTIAANLARGRRAAARLTDTLDSLMVYALSGGESLEFTPVNIGQALRELVREHFSAVAAGDGHRISLEHQIVDATVLAHRPAVDRCLQNLLHNAVKFTSASRADGRITVRSVVDSANVRVCIEDNGPGIPRDLLEQVFLPFKRGPHGGSGTGLGLSIVRRYAEAFRGRAWLESDGRSGTRVFLELPLAPIGADDPADRAVLIADLPAGRTKN